MPILRPRWKNAFIRDLVFAFSAPKIVFNITDGPGLLKGGGFSIQGFANAQTDYDLIITVDSIIIYNENWQDAATVSALATTAPWDVAISGGVNLNFDFKENVQLGFTSSLKIEVDNNGAADTVDVEGSVDYQIGA